MMTQNADKKIQERMADVGIRNLSAYMRKMALNGYVLHVTLCQSKRAFSCKKIMRIYGGTPTSIFARRKWRVY